MNASRDECSQADANRQQRAQEANDGETEMQIALASVGGDQRALFLEHELGVCGLRTGIFEANERGKRLRGELSDVPGASMRLAQLEGRLADTDLSLRPSEESGPRSAQELQAFEEHRFRQVQDLGMQLSRAAAIASMAPPASELAVQAARSETERYRWQLDAEEAVHLKIRLRPSNWCSSSRTNFGR